jgi:saccharopepsin
MRDRYTSKPNGLPLIERRDFMKGIGTVGALSLLSRSMPLAAIGVPNAVTGLAFPLVHGPFQNNGATPWYAKLGIGTPPQTLKIALDTGSDFIWVTSTLCQPDSCVHYGAGQFNYLTSDTFTWISTVDKQEDFGPWGSMTVETGRDVIVTPGTSAGKRTFYCSKAYSGTQFDQLDWDGGIGLPSGSDYADPAVSFLVEELMNSGAIDPTSPYISFDTDYSGGAGTCLIGGTDPSRYDPTTCLRLPWTPYLAYPGVQYIWSTPLLGYTVGDYTVPISKTAMFALDSGSSQFKGDDNIMNTTLQIVATKPTADVVLKVGAWSDGTPGSIVVPPSVFNVTIEAGPDKGKTLPQFQPLGLQDLVLVGSVLMDQFYTVYEYDVLGVAGTYRLIPVAMYLYEKVGGPTGLLNPPAGAQPVVLGPKAIAAGTAK